MRRCSISIRLQMEWCREKLTQGSINCKEDMYHRWYISSFSGLSRYGREESNL